MTWRTFAGAIHKAKIDKNVPVGIIGDLFKMAGCTTSPERSTINSWIYGKRNCDGRRYFPNKKAHNQGIFEYFRNRPENKLKDLQKIFQENKDPDSPVDLKTEDLDVFCWSLVNQFVVIPLAQPVKNPVYRTQGLIE